MKKKEKAGETPEIIEDGKMTDKQMDALLVSLYSRMEWKALTRLISREMIVAENSLCTIDPFKEPTEVARNQGKRMGMYTIEQYVKAVAEKSNNPNEDETLSSYNYS